MIAISNLKLRSPILPGHPLLRTLGRESKGTADEPSARQAHTPFVRFVRCHIQLMRLTRWWSAAALGCAAFACVGCSQSGSSGSDSGSSLEAGLNFNHAANTEVCTLSLHAALPTWTPSS